MSSVAGLLTGLVLSPFMLAIDAQKRIIAEGVQGNIACQALGVLTISLHRFSTFTLCFSFVDRYIVISRPMEFTERLRYSLSKVVCSFISIASIALATIPIALVPSEESAYSPLENAPMCIIVASSVELQYWIYFDIVISYIIPWMCMFTAVVCTIRVAWSSKSSKILPINIGTFNPNVIVDQHKSSFTTCWKDVSEGNTKITVESVSTPISERYSEIPLALQHTERITSNSHLNLNTRQNSCSTKTLSRNAVVPTQKPYFQTGLASLHNQHTSGWEITATTSKISDTSPPTDTSYNSSVNKSSENKVKSFDDCIMVLPVVDEEKKVGSFGQNDQKINLGTRMPATRTFDVRNMKALYTLIPILLCFMLLTLPAMLVHFHAATTTTDQCKSWEFLACLAILTSSFAYPLMLVAADRNFKQWIQRFLNKTILEDSDFESDNE
uniref:uncharacterized protein LOC113475691 n=1 Tax=Ciona intestinalis TaxID=7719 RepID=UPI000EF5544E|nr:uncharacterized protein LOC113475691 [Ciona intestinalis]|eukprot:XP_026696033.1 uncharacterized protein LOC113475691 [Ciona intestinalis]